MLNYFETSVNEDGVVQCANVATWNSECFQIEWYFTNDEFTFEANDWTGGNCDEGFDSGSFPSESVQAECESVLDYFETFDFPSSPAARRLLSTDSTTERKSKHERVVDVVDRSSMEEFHAPPHFKHVATMATYIQMELEYPGLTGAEYVRLVNEAECDRIGNPVMVSMEYIRMMHMEHDIDSFRCYNPHRRN